MPVGGVATQQIVGFAGERRAAFQPGVGIGSCAAQSQSTQSCLLDSLTGKRFQTSNELVTKWHIEFYADKPSNDPTRE